MKESQAGWANRTPVERLRALGLTQAGDTLEKQFSDSWNERARLASRKRPFIKRITLRNRVSEKEIAERETADMVARASEIASAPNRAQRNVAQTLLSEFPAKSKRELRAEDTVSRASIKVEGLVDKGDWNKAVRTIRKTQKKLTDEPEARKALLDQSLETVKKKIAETIISADGAETFKGLVTTRNLFDEPRRINIHNLSGVSPQQLENPNFINSLGDVVKEAIRRDDIFAHKVEREVLVSAGYEHGAINALPGIGAVVVDKLLTDLENGPKPFAQRAQVYREAHLGLFVDRVIQSPEVVVVVAQNLIREFNIMGARYFADAANNYTNVGLGRAVEAAIDSESMGQLVSKKLTTELRVLGPGYFKNMVDQLVSAGLSGHIQNVIDSERVKTIVIQNLINELRVLGPGYFASLAARYRKAYLGSHVDDTLDRQEIAAIVYQNLINELRVLGPGYFASAARRYRDAGFGDYVDDVMHSPEVARIVYEDLQRELRVLGQQYFNAKVNQYRSTQLDVDDIWNNKGTSAGQRRERRTRQRSGPDKSWQRARTSTGGQRSRANASGRTQSAPPRESPPKYDPDHLGYFRNLGLDPEEISRLDPQRVEIVIKRAFRRAAFRTHPDRNGPISADAFKKVNEAYEVLSDAIRRADYMNRKGDFATRR